MNDLEAAPPQYNHAEACAWSVGFVAGSRGREDLLDQLAEAKRDHSRALLGMMVARDDRDALKNYVAHRPMCPKGRYGPMRDCNCGLDEILRRATDSSPAGSDLRSASRGE